MRRQAETGMAPLTSIRLANMAYRPFEGTTAMITKKAPSKAKKKMVGYVVLSGYAEKEGTQYVSICRELGTASCGDTAEEALQNLEDAIGVHLHALAEIGESERFFRERGIRINPLPIEDELSVRVPPHKLFTTYQREVVFSPQPPAARAGRR